jgi:hypothetical protein
MVYSFMGCRDTCCTQVSGNPMYADYLCTDGPLTRRAYHGLYHAFCNAAYLLHCLAVTNTQPHCGIT